VWKKSTTINRDKLDFKVKNILCEAEKVLEKKLTEKQESPMSAAEMEKHTAEILPAMETLQERLHSFFKVRTNFAILLPIFFCFADEF
jgi:hypothetical protein